MQRVLLRLWHDDGGALIAVEWLFVATILILGVVTALIAVRQATLNELEETASATLSLSQSYSFSGQSGVCPLFVDAVSLPGSVGSAITGAYTAGSAFQDSTGGQAITGTSPEQLNATRANPCD